MSYPQERIGRRPHLLLGKLGERIAQGFVQRKGWRIVAVNFRTKVGEIDLIYQDHNTLCFAEVKTRRHTAFGQPLESVHFFKQKHMIKTAQFYMLTHPLKSFQNARFDVISIILPSDEEEPQIQFIANAFEAGF